jgi:solute carrier family 41
MREGWTPVILSMLVSSFGGLILKHAVQSFAELAPFAPVMNGAGGNLAAVCASRTSTELHSNLANGQAARDKNLLSTTEFGTTVESSRCYTNTVFAVKAGAHSRPSSGSRGCVDFALVVIVVPGSLIFVNVIVAVRTGDQYVPEMLFVALYEAAALIQASILVLAARYIVRFLWRRGIDPDNAAIPYVTSLGDVIGAALLAASFWILGELGGAPWCHHLWGSQAPIQRPN